MHWLRSALLYLFVTLLLCAGIWLFWGDAINPKMKGISQNTRKEPAARQANSVKDKTPTAKKMKPGELPVPVAQAAATGKEAWQKTSSGFEQLLQTAGADNRRLLLESVTEQDRQYRALFFGSVEQRLPKLAERQPSAPQAK